MKKTQKFFAVIMVIAMMMSCVGTIAYAEDKIEVATYDELVTALSANTGKTIYVTADLTANEGVTYTYDEATGKVIVANGTSTIAEIGTGKVSTTAGAIISGSLETLAKWTAIASLNQNKIDFQNHKISGYVIQPAGDAMDVGLFAKIIENEGVSNLVVEDILVFSNPTVAGEFRIATVAGTLIGELVNVKVEDSVILGYSTTSTVVVGGIVGIAKSIGGNRTETAASLLNNVTFDGAAIVGSGTNIVIGGLAGKLQGGKIINSINYGDVINAYASKNTGIGGLVGYVQTPQLFGPDGYKSYDSIILRNILVQNSANYGTVEGSMENYSGGLIGHTDLWWAADDVVRYENLYNGGIIKKGLNSFGNASTGFGTYNKIGVAYRDFVFEDILLANKWQSWLPAYFDLGSKVYKKVYVVDAVENLNRNAGNIEGAYAWKVVDGKALPDATIPVPEPQAALPDRIAEKVLNPETDLELISAEVATPDTIKLTFSEPVKLADGAPQPFGGIRYVKFSNGVPGYMTHTFGSKSEVLQWGTVNSWTFTGTEVAYVKIPETAWAESNALVDIVAGSGAGPAVANPLVTFCIEGFRIGPEGSTNIPYYIDNIVSLDGERTLVATPGKQDATNGIGDGFYIAVGNAYEDYDFITPRYDAETEVAIESAELAGPHSIKINFSEEVKLVEGTSAYVTVSYVEFDEKGGYNVILGDNEEALEVGATIAEINGDSITVDLGDDVDAVALLNGETWDVGGTVVVSVKQVGEDGTIRGYVDNITSADGTKMLVASAAKVDVKNGQADEAAVFATPHECDYTELTHDASGHWYECICGEADLDAKEEHNFTEGDVCSVCGANKFIPGDVDGNETKQIADAIYLLYYLSWSEEFPVNQPVDFDGNTQEQIADAIYLLYHLSWSEEFPLN